MNLQIARVGPPITRDPARAFCIRQPQPHRGLAVALAHVEGEFTDPPVRLLRAGAAEVRDLHVRGALACHATPCLRE